MAKKALGPTRAAAEALDVLAAQIRTARHEKGWTAADLATRIGVDRRTVSAIENGSPGAAIGTVLSAASVVGVHLFGAEGEELARLRRRGEKRVALLRSRVDKPRASTTSHDDLDF